MIKIAIVVQRYGENINGGAEYHAKSIAEILSKKYKVTLLTTKATDYNGWENTIQKDVESINNVIVKRFESNHKFQYLFKDYRRKLTFNKWYHRILKKINLFNFVKKYSNIFEISQDDASKFIKAQGPYCPDLITYLRTNSSKFDCFIFFTYLYYPTVEGLKIVGDKSIFIPTAHDEPLLFSKPFEKIFSLPKIILFNTKSEQELVNHHFKNTVKNQNIVGLGIDNQDINKNNINNKYKFDFPYFIYIGRIEKQKGCDLMIDYFLKSNINNSIKLVLVGKNDNYQKFKNNERIVFAGFVNEDEKYYLLEKSIALIIPSLHESLSLVTLESMQQNKLVIANKNCEVLKYHITNSGAGFLFDDANTFDKSLESVLKFDANTYAEEAKKGNTYVQKNYSWDVVENKFEKAINLIVNN